MEAERSVLPGPDPRSSTRSSLTFARKAGEKDHIFGSVTATDIKDALDKLGFEIDKKKIVLDEPLKRLGNYTVPIKVFHDDKAEIKVARRQGREESGEPAAAAEAQAPKRKTSPPSKTSIPVGSGRRRQDGGGDFSFRAGDGGLLSPPGGRAD